MCVEMVNPEIGYTRDRLIKWQFFIVLEAERSKTKVLAGGDLVYGWPPSYSDLVCRRRKETWLGSSLKKKITSPTLRAPAI